MSQDAGEKPRSLRRAFAGVLAFQSVALFLLWLLQARYHSVFFP